MFRGFYKLGTPSLRTSTYNFTLQSELSSSCINVYRSSSEAVPLATPRFSKDTRSLPPSYSSGFSRIAPRSHMLLPPNSLLFSLSILQPSADAPSAWLAFGTVVGLPLALWLYKCIMMVVFQRKIIYMGYVPMGARSEQLGIDVKPPKSLLCEEISIAGDKSVRLSGILVSKDAKPDPDVIIVYFQGNAGNPLGRIPVFERLVSPASHLDEPSHSHCSLAILAIAPRSYWKSSSRTPTEHGLSSDYRHALDYASFRFPKSSIILYGHSLGGAVAVCLASQLQAAKYPNVTGLILENPFSSTSGMVKALYPQKWLPYHYLGGFLFDKWDALRSMEQAKANSGSVLMKLSSRMLLLLSEKDELVPTSMGEKLFHASADSEEKRKTVIKGALHEDAWRYRQWSVEIKRYVNSINRNIS